MQAINIHGIILQTWAISFCERLSVPAPWLCHNNPVGPWSHTLRGEMPSTINFLSNQVKTLFTGQGNHGRWLMKSTPSIQESVSEPEMGCMAF